MTAQPSQTDDPRIAIVAQHMREWAGPPSDSAVERAAAVRLLATLDANPPACQDCAEYAAELAQMVQAVSWPNAAPERPEDATDTHSGPDGEKIFGWMVLIHDEDGANPDYWDGIVHPTHDEGHEALYTSRSRGFLSTLVELRQAKLPSD